VNTADWVRIIALIGNAILFYAAWRNQVWVKQQVGFDNPARSSQTNTTRGPTAGPSRPAPTAKPPGAPITQADLDRLTTELMSRPYFDRLAYRLLCLGFALTAIAAFIDLSVTGTFQRLIGSISH